MKDISEKDQKALSAAINEMQALLAGGETMDLRELVELKRHIKSKIDHGKAKKDLTPEDELWLTMYNSVDDLIKQITDPDTKKHIDGLVQELEDMGLYQAKLSSLIDRSKKIEKLLFQQSMLLAFASDKSEENEFARRKNIFEKAMFDEKLTAQEHMTAAQAILELVPVYEKFTVERMKKVGNELSAELHLFTEELKNFSDVKAEGIVPVKEDYARWLHLSKEVFSAMTLAANSFAKQLETDKWLPQVILENQGNAKANLSGGEFAAFKGKLVSYAALMMTANQKQEETKKELDPLRKKIFGEKIDDELANDFTENENVDNATRKVKNAPIHSSLEVHPWFRFSKVVYIILWILGVGFSILIGMTDFGFWGFVITLAIIGVILTLCKKAFLYVAIGKAAA